MKRLATAIAAIALIGTPAVAADLARKMPVKAPPPPPPAPVYSWTGCYIGGNVGPGWGRNQVTGFQLAPGFDAGSVTGTGVVGGGQIGCDYQWANWVFGVQGMFDGSDVKGDFSPNGAHGGPNPLGFSTNERLGFKIHWFDTLTARLGYAVVPQALLYVKGGAAWAHVAYSDNDPTFAGIGVFGNGSANPNGWTIGGGLEYAFLPNWSVFVEYNFMDFGSRNVTIVYNNNLFINPFTYTEKQNLQTVLFGLNYRFNWLAGRW